MNRLNKIVLLVINASGFLQLCLAAGNNDNPAILRQPNLSSLDAAQINNPLKLNEAVFSSLPLFFGNLGPVLHDIMTNENALGDEFAKSSQLIAEKIGAQPYYDSVNTILNLSTGIEFRQKLEELLSRVADLRYRLPDGGQSQDTLGDGVQIIKNIFQNRESVEELRKRITSAVDAATKPLSRL